MSQHPQRHVTNWRKPLRGRSSSKPPAVTFKLRMQETRPKLRVGCPRMSSTNGLQGTPTSKSSVVARISMTR